VEVLLLPLLVTTAGVAAAATPEALISHVSLTCRIWHREAEQRAKTVRGYPSKETIFPNRVDFAESSAGHVAIIPAGLVGDATTSPTWTIP
jgi:hypothetical protein